MMIYVYVTDIKLLFQLDLNSIVSIIGLSIVTVSAQLIKAICTYHSKL